MHRVVDAATHLADALEVSVLLRGNDQTSKVVLAVGLEADNHASEGFTLFHLDPCVRALARQIPTIAPLRNHAFEPEFGNLAKERLAGAVDGETDNQMRIVAFLDKFRKSPAAKLKRLVHQRFKLGKKKVE